MALRFLWHMKSARLQRLKTLELANQSSGIMMTSSANASPLCFVSVAFGVFPVRARAKGLSENKASDL